MAVTVAVFSLGSSNIGIANFQRLVEFILPKTVMELETNMASNHTAAILKPTIRLVDVCRVLNGFRMPRYRPSEMKHMCIMLAEHASTSHVTYTLHQSTPNGQYPATFNKSNSSRIPTNFYGFDKRRTSVKNIGMRLIPRTASLSVSPAIVCLSDTFVSKRPYLDAIPLLTGYLE